MAPPPAVSELTSPALRLRVGEPLDTSTLAHALEPRAWLRIRFVIDALVLSLAAAGAVLGGGSLHFSSLDHLVAFLFLVVVLSMIYVRRGPDERLSSSVIDTVTFVVGTISLGAMLAIVLDTALGLHHPLSLPLRLWVFSLVYLGIARIVLRSVRQYAFAFDACCTPTLIVGAGIVGQQLTRRLLEDRTYGLRPVGLIDDDPLPRDHYPDRPAVPYVPVLGGVEDLLDVLDATGARRLILAYSSDPDRLLIEKLEECRRRGIDVLLVPRLYELMNERSTLDHVGGMPVVSLRATDPRSGEFAVKHAFDRLFAGALLIALAPVIGTVALLVWLTSPGPILFRQRRVGRDGRVFDLLKFRTMRMPPEGGEFFELKNGCAPGGVEGADRRTLLGRSLRRSSIDELPQLINVVRGDMSIVGPRPERPEYVERFALEVDRYNRRHRVKSGITGWAQVRGLRGQTSIADRVEWDNFYIQNWSLWLDLKIIALTMAEVFRFRG